MTLSSMWILSDGGVRHERGGSGSGILVVPAEQEHRGAQSGHCGDDHREPAVYAKFRSQRQGNAYIHEVNQGQRDQDMPAEAHQLIKAKAREYETQPHEDVNISGNLQKKPERAIQALVHLLERKRTQGIRNRKNGDQDEAGESHGPQEKGLRAGGLLTCPENAIRDCGNEEQCWRGLQPSEPVDIGEWPQPSAEKERGANGSDDDHARVVGEEIERPAEPSMSGHVAGDQFGFDVRKIKGRAIRFADGSDEISKKSDGSEENIPGVIGALSFHNRADIQRAGTEEATDERKTRRGFIADELGGAAKRAEDGVVIVGGPTAEDDAQGDERADADDEQHADVDVARHWEPGSEGDRAEGSDRGSHGNDRRDPEDEPVGVFGDQIFLEDKFQRIGNGLQQAVRNLQRYGRVRFCRRN